MCVKICRWMMRAAVTETIVSIKLVRPGMANITVIADEICLGAMLRYLVGYYSV